MSSRSVPERSFVGHPHPARVQSRYLRVYLNDHLAVSGGIAALVERMRSAERWADQRPMLDTLADVLAQDSRDLEGVLRGRSLRANPVKRLLAIAGERAGRAKGNGRLVRPSPLARLVELEGLLLGLAACMSPWQTLVELGVEPERASTALQRLQDVRARVESLQSEVRAGAFAD